MAIVKCEAMTKQMDELIELCTEYPKEIPLIECAKYIGMDKDCLRESIDQGKCKFGVGGRKGTQGNRFSKIPTLAFFNFMTQGAYLEN